jgi:hypothetical protein
MQMFLGLGETASTTCKQPMAVMPLLANAIIDPRKGRGPLPGNGRVTENCSHAVVARAAELNEL